MQTIYNVFGATNCDGCPDNLLAVWDSQTARDVIGVVAVLGAGFVLFGTAAVLFRCCPPASPPLRRTLAPIFLTSAATLFFIGLAIAVSFVSTRASDIVWWFVVFSFALVPLAFLAGLLQIRLARASVAVLVVELLSADGLRELRDAIARTLNDPDLDLAVWLPDTYEWIGSDGRPYDLATESVREGKTTTFVEHEGEVVAALVHDSALADERDLIDAVSAAASLALARERSVEALRQSEGRYRALLDAAPDLMFRFDREGTYLDFNGHPEDLITPPEQLLGSRAHDVLPAEVADKIVNGVREAIDTGRLVTGDYRVEIDGVERDFEARIVKDGEEAILVAREFTELKHLASALERERDFIRTVVDNAPSLFCMIDPEGRIVRFNQTLEQLSGVRDEAHMREKRFWEVFIVPEEAEEVHRELASLAAEGAAGEHENHWRAAGGGEAVVAWSTTPLLDEHGRPNFLISAIDITERKQQEASSATRASASCRPATRSGGGSSATSTTAPSSGSSRSRWRCGSRRRSWRRTRRRRERCSSGAAEELAQALEELRELARGIHPAVPHERGLSAALEALAGRAPLPVEVSAPGRTAAPAVEAAAYYVVSEALANVAKYAQASRVGVSVIRHNGGAVVEVADDGVGGADPPAAPVCAAWPTASRRSTAASGRQRTGRRDRHPRRDPVRVVLADDSVLLREGIARILDEAGFEVVGQAGTADELLLKVRSYSPDVAIVDIRMPPTHTDEGLRAAQEIREKHPDVRRARALAVRRARRTRSSCSPRAPRASATCSRTGSRTSTSSPPRSGASARAARRSTRRSSRSSSAGAGATTRSTS